MFSIRGLEIEMNTLNYIGCKNKLSSRLFEIMQRHLPDLSHATVSDLFMGSGVISYRLSERVKRVLANDLERYSFVIGNAILRCNFSDRLKDHIERLNSLTGVDGLIFQHYSPHQGCERMFFTTENARKADAMRLSIQQCNDQGDITQEEYYFLLGSLLVSLDRVANTTSVYGAYLKKFKASALRSIVLLPIHSDRDRCRGQHIVRCGFAEEVNDMQEMGERSDITYLDPPYNQRSYSANYFVLNYVAMYDPALVPRGKTGIIGENQSDFCSRPRVREAFTRLLQQIQSPLIVISYNNEGLLSREEFVEILQRHGEITLYRIPYPKFKAQREVESKNVEEYVWVVNRHGEATFREMVLDS